MRILDIILHSGNSLFDLKIGRPRTVRKSGKTVPDLFNLSFRYNGTDRPALAGGGIYAIRYHGELLYIGIYTGHDQLPFTGNVARERLSKHLEALTMRGRRVGFSEANYDASIAMPDSPLVTALRSSRAQRGNGGVRSYPCKVEFAAQHWPDMSTIEHDPTILAGFEFLYGRIHPDHYRPDITYAELKGYIAAIEDTLIQDLSPRCNERFSTPRLGNLKHGPSAEAWSELRNMLSSGRWRTSPAAPLRDA